MTTTTTVKEQWEALIVESRFWRRPRETKLTKFTVFDSTDQETILETHISDFRDKGGFRTPLDNLRSLDHPLSRFYRLFYTDEFSDFRSRTFSEVGGAASLSRGVAELLIDQTFRYFLFVDADERNARWFGQLVVGISVFRNTFDETSMEFLKSSLRQTNRRIFNTALVPGTVRKIEEGGDEGEDVEEDEEDEAATDVFQEEGLMLEYPRIIAQMLRGNRMEQDFVDDMLNLSVFGRIPTKNVSFNFPLSTNISLFNPHRRILLHVLHLLSLHASPEEEIEVIYVGDLEDYAKISIKELIPRNVGFVPLPSRASKMEIVSARTSGKSFILVLDQGGDDDSTLFQQIGLLRTLPKDRVRAVSLTLRIPSSRSVENGGFKFCRGAVLQTPWKNPKDPNMRLVWEPSDELDVVYGVNRLYNARCFQDYVVRPLYRFSPTVLTSTDEPFGLIAGDFDSELEKYILQEYYNKFPAGLKTWVEVVDSEEGMDVFTILSSIRFLAYEKKLTLEKMIRFEKEILNHHLSDPSNPLFSDAVKIRRGGLFPTLYQPASPLVEAIDRVFGGKDDEKTLSIYDNYQRLLQSRADHIRQMELKNIFPREPSKDNFLPLLRDLAPRSFGDLISREPAFENVLYAFSPRQFVRPEDKGRDYVLVQLGDTLGNVAEAILGTFTSGYESERLSSLYAFGSFDPGRIWKVVSGRKLEIFFFPESQIQTLRSKLPPNSPFILIEGYIPDSTPQLRETVRVAGRELANLSGYRGTIRQGVEGVSYEPYQGSGEIAKIARGMRRDTLAENCLVIGGEYEDVALNLVANRALHRVHILVETDAGARICESRLEAVRFPRRVTQRIFVQEDLTRSLVPPIKGQRYDFVLCSPIVFSRFFETRETSRDFLTCLQEDLLKEGGRLHTLVIPKREVVESLSRAELTENRMFSRYGDFSFPVGKSAMDIQTYRYKSRQFFASDFDVESLNSGLSSQRGEYNPDLHPFEFFTINQISVRELGGVEAFRAYQGMAVDSGKKVRETNNYVKRLLIGGVSDKTEVLDLACGHGQDLAKWFTAENNVRTYVGLDGSEKAIREGRKRFRSYDVKPSFFKMDAQNIFGNSSWTIETSDYVRGRGYSTVSCQLSIHYGFSSEETIRTFMMDVAQLLRMNGEFIVSTLDYEQIAQRTKRALSSQVDASEVVISGEHYRIRMEPEVARKMGVGDVVGAGMAYSFHQFPKDEMSRETVEYIVDGRFFERVAKDVGLQLMVSENFLEFSPGDGGLGRLVGDLEESERDVVGLYRVFKFKKVSNLRDVPVERKVPVKDLRMDTWRMLAKEVAREIPIFSRGLLYRPEDMNPAPHYSSHSYEILHMVAETVFGIPPIFQSLRDVNVLDDRQRVFVQTNALAFQPPNKSYDHVFLGPGSCSGLGEEGLRRISGFLSEGGTIQGCYVDRESVSKLFTNPLDDSFANSLFSIRLEGENRYLLNENDPELSQGFLDMNSLRTICSRIGLGVSSDISVYIPDGLRDHQKKFFGIFKQFSIRREDVVATQVTKPKAVERVVPEPAEEGEIILSTVDRFVLVPRMLKKAPGMASGESLRAESNRRYSSLSMDLHWRAKLSDSFEGGSPVRMETGELFKSVSMGLVYYRAQFAGYEGYEALNLNSGLPYPENLKPLTKAPVGRRGKEWKEQEPRVMEKIYIAKFTNVGGQDGDPANLTPLRALLLTGEAQLFSDAKTRNELLEQIRARVRVIYGNL